MRQTLCNLTRIYERIKNLARSISVLTSVILKCSSSVVDSSLCSADMMRPYYIDKSKAPSDAPSRRHCENRMSVHLFVELLHEVVDELGLEDEQLRGVAFVEPDADESGDGVLVGVDGELMVGEARVGEVHGWGSLGR